MSLKVMTSELEVVASWVTEQYARRMAARSDDLHADGEDVFVGTESMAVEYGTPDRSASPFLLDWMVP
jgi:hypothetical protein